MRRSLSLRLRLAILVAGTILPLIGFAAAIVYQHYRQDQRDAFARVLQNTRSIQLVLDREMQGIVSGLTVLAGSDSLSRGDFEGFRSRAKAFLAQFPDAPSIVIGDREGRQVFQTGKPVFSELFTGSVSNRPIVTVTVPVLRDGVVVYDLSFDPPLEIFQRIIEQQKPGEDWTLSIFDQQGANFARVPNPQGTVGREASPSLFAVMFSAKEGQARTTSLEGVPLLTAFVPSDLNGWISAAGIAEKTLVAPAVRSFLLTAAIGTAILAVVLAFAIRMSTTIARGEALHNLLIDEINHRVKNTLATVQSLATQTFRDGTDPASRAKFGARLVSLGRAHDVLSAKKWEGADVRDVVNTTLEPFASVNPDRIVADGPSVPMSSRTVVMLSLVLHELATNASKYGALSGPAGRVTVSWMISPVDKVKLYWRETGGPPVEKPQHADSAR